MTSVTILSAKLSYKLGRKESLQQFSDNVERAMGFKVRGKKIDCTKYSSIREQLFEDRISDLAKMGKINGEIVVVKTTNDSFTEGKYIFESEKAPIFMKCQLNITCKKPSAEEKKAFTEEEKKALLIEFIKEANKLPDKKEVYKDCNIGQYYYNAQKWNEIYDGLKDYIEGCVDE